MNIAMLVVVATMMLNDGGTVELTSMPCPAPKHGQYFAAITKPKALTIPLCYRYEGGRVVMTEIVRGEDFGSYPAYVFKKEP